MARKDHNIESNVEVSGQELSGFVGEDEDLDEIDVLGFATMSTVGGARGLTVPRDWLTQRMEDLDFPDFMIPNEPRTSSAFKRAMKYHRLIEQEEKVINGHRVKSDVQDGENNTYHVLSNVYVSAREVAENEGIDYVEDEESGDILNEEGEVVTGDWRQAELGRFQYRDGEIMTRTDLGEESPLWDEWVYLRERGHDLFEELQESHVGYDFQVMTYHLRKHWTNSVPLRDGGAVAFIPATPKVTQILEAMHTLFKEVNNEYKDMGRDIELNTIPVLNTEDQQKMVRERAEEELDDVVGTIVDEAREQVQEEIPVKEIAREIQTELSDAETFESQYNTLLDAELSARRRIEDWMTDFDEDLREVLTHAGFDPEAREIEPEIEEKGGGYYSIKVDGEEVESIRGRESAESYVEDHF